MTMTLYQIAYRAANSAYPSDSAQAAGDIHRAAEAAVERLEIGPSYRPWNKYEERVFLVARDAVLSAKKQPHLAIGVRG